MTREDLRVYIVETLFDYGSYEGADKITDFIIELLNNKTEIDD